MRELPPFLLFLEGKGHRVETLIVNDGSTESNRLTEFCSEHSLSLISHSVNKGKGAAVRTGMLSASAPIRIFTDADIPFQYETMQQILDAFEGHEVDVVVGDRTKSDYFAQTALLRRLGSMFFSATVDLIMFKRMGDTQCGIKGFRSTCVEAVFDGARLDSFAADIEWLHRAQMQGLTIRPVSAEFRNAGQSSVVFWKHALLMLRDVIKIRFS